MLSIRMNSMLPPRKIVGTLVTRIQHMRYGYEKQEQVIDGLTLRQVSEAKTYDRFRKENKTKNISLPEKIYLDIYQKVDPTQTLPFSVQQAKNKAVYDREILGVNDLAVPTS